MGADLGQCHAGDPAVVAPRSCRGWEVPGSLVASPSVADVRGRGALVISLDFELHWGMRDHTPVDPAVTRTLVASRSMVVTLAELFARREVRATWATVGLLFATTGAEARALSPATRPAYRMARLDPYPEPIGPTEDEDPLHLAGSLVDRVASFPGQELASHTFSHYYCLEP